jgi:hypothetical protein
MHVFSSHHLPGLVASRAQRRLVLLAGGIATPLAILRDETNRCVELLGQSVDGRLTRFRAADGEAVLQAIAACWEPPRLAPPSGAAALLAIDDELIAGVLIEEDTPSFSAKVLREGSIVELVRTPHMHTMVVVGVRNGPHGPKVELHCASNRRSVTVLEQYCTRVVPTLDVLDAPLARFVCWGRGRTECGDLLAYAVAREGMVRAVLLLRRGDRVVRVVGGHLVGVCTPLTNALRKIQLRPPGVDGEASMALDLVLPATEYSLLPRALDRIAVPCTLESKRGSIYIATLEPPRIGRATLQTLDGRRLLGRRATLAACDGEVEVHVELALGSVRVGAP